MRKKYKFYITAPIYKWTKIAFYSHPNDVKPTEALLHQFQLIKTQVVTMFSANELPTLALIIVIIIVIFKCYFSEEHIALSTTTKTTTTTV